MQRVSSHIHLRENNIIIIICSRINDQYQGWLDMWGYLVQVFFVRDSLLPCIFLFILSLILFFFLSLSPPFIFLYHFFFLPRGSGHLFFPSFSSFETKALLFLHDNDISSNCHHQKVNSQTLTFLLITSCFWRLLQHTHTQFLICHVAVWWDGWISTR